MTSARRAGRDPIVNHEIASDLIDMIVAWLNGRVRRERNSPEPDQALIAYLRREAVRWQDVRRGLYDADEEAVARAIAEYGAIVRELHGERA